MNLILNTKSFNESVHPFIAVQKQYMYKLNQTKKRSYVNDLSKNNYTSLLSSFNRLIFM